MADKYSAVWVSHTSISDYLKCPRAYYLKNMYKDPKTGHKIKITSPAMALGLAVHAVVEALSVIPTDKRFNESLITKFDKEWERVSGKKGGFTSPEQESKYKNRGEEMISRVVKNPGPLKELAVKIQMDLPHYWLSENDGIILCGKIDWLQYLPDEDSVHIIDFKTSKNKEEEDSLQLPIYRLLVHNCQKRKVVGASYWYLDSDDELTPKELPDLEESHTKVLTVAKKIKLARQLEKFDCPEGEKGCFCCGPMESILRGEGEFVGNDEYGNDVYMLNSEEAENLDGVVL